MIRAWRVNVRMVVLLYPAGQLKTFWTTHRYVRPILKSPASKKWSPETVAVIAASTMLRDTICNHLSPGDRARCLERLKAVPPMDLVDELEWLPKVRRGEVKGMQPLDFRLTWMSALATRWLIDKKINAHTKALLSHMVAYSLADMPNDDFDVLIQDLMPQIGLAEALGTPFAPQSNPAGAQA
jgi:hypothetical protein